MNEKRISLLAVASLILAATAIISAALFVLLNITWLIMIPLLSTVGGLGTGIGSLLLMKVDPRLTGRTYAIAGVLVTGGLLILLLAMARLPLPT